MTKRHTNSIADFFASHQPNALISIYLAALQNIFTIFLTHNGRVGVNKKSQKKTNYQTKRSNFASAITNFVN